MDLVHVFYSSIFFRGDAELFMIGQGLSGGDVAAVCFEPFFIAGDGVVEFQEYLADIRGEVKFRYFKIKAVALKDGIDPGEGFFCLCFCRIGLWEGGQAGEQERYEGEDLHDKTRLRNFWFWAFAGPVIAG